MHNEYVRGEEIFHNGKGGEGVASLKLQHSVYLLHYGMCSSH